MLIGQVRAIRVLCEVAEHGSFSAAAGSLGMTQSAVSQHIAGLERATGLAVLDRGTRPVELTEAGAVLIRHGRTILARLEDAEQEVAEMSGRRSGRLRLGSFPTALATFVPTALATFRAEAPSVVLTMIDDHMQGLLPRLERGELDLAVAYGDAAARRTLPASMTSVPLFDDAYRVLLPEGHRLARRRRRPQLADLADEPWVGGHPGSTWYRIVAQSCRTAGFEPRASLRTDDYRAVHAFVAAGLGVAVVPGLAAAHRLPGVEVRDLATSAPVRQVGVVHLAHESASAPVQTMTAILRDVTQSWRRRPAVRRRA